MEFLNKIEIRGIVGNVAIHKVGDSALARVSVATDYAYKDRSGAQLIDTTWFNVIIWERSDAKSSINEIKKGSKIYVEGRVRLTRFTDNNGVDRSVWEIVARKWNLEG